MFSLAVFLEPMSTATGWSRAGISSAMTLNFLAMGLGAFGWGAASDRFGTRIVVLIGARAARAGAGAGEPGDHRCSQFQLTYGILVGLAASAFFAPMIAADHRLVRAPTAASRSRSSPPAWASRR